MKLKEMIKVLTKLEQELGDCEVSICIEPCIKKVVNGFYLEEQVQFEDMLKAIANDGERIILLGESFD